MGQHSLQLHRVASRSLCILLVLALSMMTPLPQSQAAYAEEVDIAPPIFQSRNDYLEQYIEDDAKEAIESSRTPIDDFLGLIGFKKENLHDSGHTLYAKLTLIDSDFDPAVETFDDYFQHEGWMDGLAGQFDLAADLLDPGEGFDYFIADVSAPSLKGITEIIDAAFTTLDNDGNIVDGPYFDYEHSIIYVPKDLYLNEDQEIAFALQAQLLARCDLNDAKECDIDIRITSADMRVKVHAEQSIRASRFDVATTIPVTNEEYAQFLSLDDLEVKINGSSSRIELIDGVNASFNQMTGELELFIAPMTLRSVDIHIKSPSILEYLSAPALGYAPSSSLSFVPDVVFNKLDVSKLKVGQVFDFYTDLNYWWPNVDDGDYGWQACVASGSYCYSWVNDPDSLYEYIAWNNGATWNGVAQGDVSNFQVTPSSSQAARNYFNYVFWFGEHNTGGQWWHSDKWPVNCEWDYGANYAHFGLQCCHTTNALPAGSDPTEGTMKFRILDLNTTSARPYVVLGFVGPAQANQPGVGVYKFAIEAYGKIDISKTSSVGDISLNNPNYRFQGIAYDIFTGSDASGYKGSVYLDANGNGTSIDLLPGTYYVKENKGSSIGKGYAYDEAIYPVQVTSGTTSKLAVTDIPQSASIDVLLSKKDSVTANSTPQGDATFENALFEVAYYVEALEDSSDLDSLSPRRSWIFRTDHDGRVLFSDDYFVSGDSLYRNSSGHACLPLGSIAIKETKAPLGYQTCNEVVIKRITPDGINEDIQTFISAEISEEVIRGGVSIEKLDSESLLESPLGSAMLDGTTFEITNESEHPVSVNNILFDTGKVVATITSEQGIATTSDDFLPFGTYSIKEVDTPDGYLLSDTTARIFEINNTGEMVNLSNGNAVKNQVIRGDISFVKIREKDQSRLEGIPFSITSKTTGECHIAVTGTNGVFDTSSSWTPHTNRTNANDEALNEDGTVDETKLDENAGIWFGKTSFGLTQPNNSYGALPYDTYDIEELPCEKNRDLELVTLHDIKINRHAFNVNEGTITDMEKPVPYIQTRARNAQDSSKYLYASNRSTLIDRVEYTNLTPGNTYKIEGSLHLQTSGDAISEDLGKVNASKEFVCDTQNGYIELEFELNTLQLTGQKIVCYEILSNTASSEVVATHTDKDDSDQILTINEPQINTYATNAITNDKVLGLETNSRIVDAVHFNNLNPYEEYTVNGQVMIKDSDGADASELIDANGNPVKSSITFVPSTPTGTVSVEFNFDTSKLDPDTELVVFETLDSGDTQYLSHTDPQNDAQTVRIATPYIATSAHEKNGTHDMLARSGSETTREIVDEVHYFGLQSGHEYTIVGQLMQVCSNDDASTMEVFPYTDEQGNELIATRTFMTHSTDGIVDVPFNINLANNEATHLVVYEQILDGDNLIASHEDPTSEEQSIYIRSDEPYDDISRSTRSLSSLPQTGDSNAMLAILILAAIVAICGCLYADKMIEKHVHKGRHTKTQRQEAR